MSNLEYVGGQWNPVGTYRGPPPGGAVRPLLPTAGKPYDLNQWNQLPASKRGGFADRASYLRWWKRVVEPKLTKPKAPAGQTITQNPHGGGPQATATVDTPAPAPAKDPRLLAYERSIEERQRYSLGQAEAAAKIMAALNAVQGAEPGQIRDAYQGAADRTVGYAQNMTGALGEQAQSAAQEAASAIAAAGAPGTGITSEAGSIANTLNYTGGYIPGTNLAAEAANQMTNALTQNKASVARLAELGNQQLRDSAKEIEELRYKAIEMQGTIAGEDFEKKLKLREADRADLALRVQIGQLQELANAKNAWEQAEAMTNMTGYVYKVVNGKPVRTNQVATGSESFTKAQTAETSRLNNAATNQRIKAQNRVANGLANAKLDISAANLKIAQDREARLAKGSPKKGGFTPKQKADWRGDARLRIDWGIDQKKPPVDVLRGMMNDGVPFSIAIDVMRKNARARPELKAWRNIPWIWRRT